MITPVSIAEGTRESTLAAYGEAVENSIHVMHSHLSEQISLEDLADSAYLSPFHFNRVFRQMIGIPPGEFLAALRLQTARELLLSSDRSVLDVCFDVGYTSTGTFTTRFTQLVGCSPGNLRRRAQIFEQSPHDLAIAQPILAHDRAIVRTTSLIGKRVPPRSLSGQIIAPSDFQGAIYIGIFPRPIPQGIPIRFAQLDEPGPFWLLNVPDGIYFLMACAFPNMDDSRRYLIPGSQRLVAGTKRPLTVINGRFHGETSLVLRQSQLTDPPFVMGLPLL